MRGGDDSTRERCSRFATGSCASVCRARGGSGTQTRCGSTYRRATYAGHDLRRGRLPRVGPPCASSSSRSSSPAPGSVRFDQLNADTLSFNISGAGDGQVAGSTKDLTLKMSGKGEFRGDDLRAERGDISLAASARPACGWCRTFRSPSPGAASSTTGVSRQSSAASPARRDQRARRQASGALTADNLRGA